MDRLWANLAARHRRPVITVAAGTVLAGGAILAGAVPAAAADATIRVNCATADLQAAINSARPGATLHVTGTCTGAFSIDKNLRLTGGGAAELDGTGDGAFTLTVGSGAIVRLTDLTITGGGGGIDNEGTLTVRDSKVTGNGSMASGGIVNSGTLTLDDTPVTHNGDTFGGPAAGGGGIANSGTLTLDDSPVTNNVARKGGGIENSGSATLQRSPVTANSALVAGGIFNAGTITLDRSAVRDNTAGQIAGGIFNAGTVTLHRSPVTGNKPQNCEPPGSVAGCHG
jgi:hypothetical protein